MKRSYFTIAIRNLLKGRLYTFINLVCLSTGMASFLLIWLFIRDEQQFDRKHPEADRIFRVIQVVTEEGGGEESSSLPFPMRGLMVKQFPDEVESAVRLFNYQSPYAAFSYGYKRFIENKFYLVDSNFFQLFGFPLLQGDPHRVLVNPNSVVISSRVANKYFGDADPIGKKLRIDGQKDLTVTGIAGPLPGGSHIDFDFLVSMVTLGPVIESLEKNFVWNPAWTYIVLKEGVDPKIFEKKLVFLAHTFIEPSLKNKCEFLLQPITDIHLNSHLDYEMQANSDITNIYIFFSVGLFILLIACINFMNLSTARSAGRAHEVGIRKVSGATKMQLVGQFLTESVLLSMLSILPALALAELSLPLFNQLSGKSLELNFGASPEIIPILLLLALGVGIVSGIYPALFLSAFEPLRVLKGVFQQGKRSIFFRKGLVVFQFTISIVLIIGTLITREQLGYMQSAGLGFDKNNLLMVPTDRTDAWEKLDTLRRELSTHPGFVNMTTMDYLIGVQTNTHDFLPENRDTSRYAYYPGLKVDPNFVKTMGMQIVAGRDFLDSIGDDTLAVVINESMVKQMKWNKAEDALGRQFFTRKGKERVVGVVKDFNFGPLRQQIGPFALDLPNGSEAKEFFTKFITIRIKPEYKNEFLLHLEKVWNRHILSRPFDYVWLSEAIDEQYGFEEKLAKLIGYFSVLAIFIACLSLFGLSSFATQQRMREIGIRKILGASGVQIIKLLIADFAKLVLIAIGIAAPIAWVTSKYWLKDFAYHVNPTFSAFLFSSAISMGMALITTSYHAIRAAASKLQGRNRN